MSQISQTPVNKLIVYQYSQTTISGFECRHSISHILSHNVTEIPLFVVLNMLEFFIIHLSNFLSVNCGMILADYQKMVHKQYFAGEAFES